MSCAALRQPKQLSKPSILLLCRHGDAPVVADLLTAEAWVGKIGYARDVVAVLIARG